MYIKNVSIIYGKELEYLNSMDIAIKDGIFSNENDGAIFNAEGLLMIPSFINAHTHIGDSICKDITFNMEFNQAINPIFGIKRIVLNKSKEEHIISFMRNAILSMLKRGITAFADFREGGINGVRLAKDANKGINAKIKVLARVEYYHNINEIRDNHDLPEHAKDEAKEVVRIADGLGLSGANEYSNKALEFFNSIRDGKLIAIHASESRDVYDTSIKNFGVSDLRRIIDYLKPDILVHMTNARESIEGANIVICPRANGSLGVGIPNIKTMIENRCKVAIGTDNIMINSPDLFKEMDYLFKVSRALGYRIEAKEILKMVTVNPSEMLQFDLGYIDYNKPADAIFIDKHSIDLDPMHDPYASIIHRVDASNIRAVMMDGRIIHGEL
ncbi:MAG: amidohydrolase family protein [Candidatus Nitrosocaldaceae archaeon]